MNSKVTIPEQVDKLRLAGQFGKAAADYDNSATIQHHCGRKLEAHLEAADVIMDLGCGTGYHLKALSQKANQLIAADIAADMLEQAKSKGLNQIRYIQQDAEYLTASGVRVNGIFSNMALQWCNSLNKALNECYQTLEQGGFMVFTTLVDGTLSELKQSWKAADGNHHVNDFLSLHAVQQAIADTDFVLEYESLEQEVVYYQQPLELLKDLKNIGANLVNQRGQQGCTGKARFRSMLNKYEEFRTVDGQVPATYQVYYAKLRKT